MPFELPELPYSKDAFGDLISSKTFDFHHGKHHQAYVTKTNDAIEGGDLANASLSEVILAAKDSGNQGLFNNSAQIWNHSFYWQCLSPDKKNPSGSLAARIEDCFGSKSEMLTALKNEAVGHFASGWAWLVLNGDKLEITSLHDADTPVAHEGMQPLLTIDVWEHAYYLDFQNDRGAYVDALLDHVNWEFVAQNMDGKGVSRADQG